MKQICAVLMTFALIAATLAIAQARGAPRNVQPLAVVKMVPDAPTVVSVPPLTTGYDVIQNISKKQTLQTSVTTERRGQSTTGARRSDLKQSTPARPQPEPVLLA